jgi:membrane protease YdiL (CAAX protease family)
MIPSFIDHILVLLLGLILPFLSGLRGIGQLQEIRFDEHTRKRFYISNGLVLWVMAAVVVGIWLWNERPLAGMGFRPAEGNPATYALTTAMVLLYLADILLSVHSPKYRQESTEPWDTNLPFLPEHPRELPAYAFLCLSAGICEEILYRGFLVTFFIDPMKPGFPFLAAIVPALLFALAHFYQGYRAMVKIFILSLFFALVFLFSKSLLIVMAVHVLIDLAGGILAMKMRGK